MKAEIAAGELIDKITILAIKRQRIADPARLRNVEHEYAQLSALHQAELPADDKLAELEAALLAVNEIIWQVEDDIRDCERRQDFGPAFIALARAVYINNDQRAAIKREINERLHSAIVEEKSYTAY